MIVVLRPDIQQDSLDALYGYFSSRSYKIHESQGENHMILGIIGDTSRLDEKDVEGIEGVASVFRVSESYKLCSRTFQPTDTVISVKGIPVGGRDIVVIAGPCSVENEEMVKHLSEEVCRAGAHIYRGGTFKPRSSPYTFQGLGEKGLHYLAEAAESQGMPVVSEITDMDSIDLFLEKSDILQVGARNMYNYSLLKELAKVDKPVILKRGLSATLDEWLNSAEYLLNGGNRQVILCERGFRTFEKSTRFTLDLSSVPVLKSRTHLPVIVDPSHAMGNRNYVLAMSRAAVAAGADGIMVEVHHDPKNALSDGPQSLYPQQFEQLMVEIRSIARAIGRDVYGA